MAKKLVIDTSVDTAQLKVVDSAAPLAATEEEVYSSNKDIPVGQAANSFVVAVKAQHIGTALPASNIVGGVVIGLNEDIYFQDTTNDVNSGIYEIKSLAPLTWGRAEYSLHPAFRENYKIMLVGHGSGTKSYELFHINGYNTGMSFGAIKVADLSTEEGLKSLFLPFITKGTLNKYRGEAANDTQLLSLLPKAGDKIILSPLYAGNLDPFKGRGLTFIGKDSPISVNINDYKDNELKPGSPYLLDSGAGNGYGQFQYTGNATAPLKLFETVADGSGTTFIEQKFLQTSNFLQGTGYTITPAIEIPALKAKAIAEGITIIVKLESGIMGQINTDGTLVALGDPSQMLTDAGAEVAPPAPAFSNTKTLALDGFTNQHAKTAANVQGLRLSVSNSWSMLFQMKALSSIPRPNFIGGQGNIGTSGWGVFVRGLVDPANLMISFRLDSGIEDVGTAFFVSLDKIHRVLFTWSGIAPFNFNAIAQYLNGSIVTPLETSGAKTILPPNNIIDTVNPFRLGINPAFSNSFRGFLDEVAIYNHGVGGNQFTAAEAADLTTKTLDLNTFTGAAGKTRNNELKAWYRMGDTAGDIGGTDGVVKNAATGTAAILGVESDLQLINSPVFDSDPANIANFSDITPK